uniref:Transmembrane protein n=1 Tax=Romanomermis culicivorax TaxID=13658 RepID=A0A915L5I9_ROMCU
MPLLHVSNPSKPSRHRMQPLLQFSRFLNFLVAAIVVLSAATFAWSSFGDRTFSKTTLPVVGESIRFKTSDRPSVHMQIRPTANVSRMQEDRKHQKKGCVNKNEYVKIGGKASEKEKNLKKVTRKMKQDGESIKEGNVKKESGEQKKGKMKK